MQSIKGVFAGDFLWLGAIRIQRPQEVSNNGLLHVLVFDDVEMHEKTLSRERQFMPIGFADTPAVAVR